MIYELFNKQYTQMGRAPLGETQTTISTSTHASDNITDGFQEKDGGLP